MIIAKMTENKAKYMGKAIDYSLYDYEAIAYGAPSPIASLQTSNVILVIFGLIREKF